MGLLFKEIEQFFEQGRREFILVQTELKCPEKSNKIISSVHDIRSTISPISVNASSQLRNQNEELLHEKIFEMSSNATLLMDIYQVERFFSQPANGESVSIFSEFEVAEQSVPTTLKDGLTINCQEARQIGTANLNLFKMFLNHFFLSSVLFNAERFHKSIQIETSTLYACFRLTLQERGEVSCAYGEAGCAYTEKRPYRLGILASLCSYLGGESELMDVDYGVEVSFKIPVSHVCEAYPVQSLYGSIEREPMLESGFVYTRDGFRVSEQIDFLSEPGVNDIKLDDKRILVIEDEETQVMLYEQYLLEVGFTANNIVCIESLSEIKQLVNNKEVFDLVISDRNLPIDADGIDGFAQIDTVHALLIKLIKDKVDVRKVILASGMETNINNDMLRLVAGLLVKPITLPSLQMKIMEVLLSEKRPL